MDIVRIATEWAKAEVFSAKIFILFGIMFIIAAVGFWQLGKTEMARAYLYPTLVVGGLLLSAGLSFYFSNTSKISQIETEYKANPTEFIKSEIARTEQTMNTYENVAFKVFPAIIALAALLFVFVERPIWRAIFVTIIAFLLVLIWMDSSAHERMKAYHEQLILVDKK